MTIVQARCSSKRHNLSLLVPLLMICGLTGTVHKGNLLHICCRRTDSTSHADQNLSRCSLTPQPSTVSQKALSQLPAPLLPCLIIRSSPSTVTSAAASVWREKICKCWGCSGKEIKCGIYSHRQNIALGTFQKAKTNGQSIWLTFLQPTASGLSNVTLFFKFPEEMLAATSDPLIVVMLHQPGKAKLIANLQINVCRGSKAVWKHSWISAMFTMYLNVNVCICNVKVQMYLLIVINYFLQSICPCFV